jgi:hypothetical protein
MAEFDHRHLIHAKLLRRHQPAMVGDDDELGVDEDRIVEPESLDRGGDLLDLLGRMGALLS